MRLRKLLRRIHRWVGIIASVWLLLLASTGFLLQHKDDWNLSNHHTQSSWILSVYGIGDNYTSYQNKQESLAQLDQQIFINLKASSKLQETIVGAVYQQPNWVVATSTQLLWIDSQGQIVKSIDELDDMPVPITQLGLANKELFIQHNQQTINVDSFEIYDAPVEWSNASNAEELKQKLIKTSTKDYLSYEQIIFDLHAGITSPSLFNDFAALALIFLSISGIIIFFKKSFKSQKPHVKIK
jgi:hypothetical protein